VRRSAILSAIALGTIGLACEQEPPLATEWVYESAQVDVFVEPGMAFCRGDGASMDAHVLALADELEVDLPERIPVWVVGDDRGAEIEEWCSGMQYTTGCFRDSMIMSMVATVPHELNHAVFNQLNPEVHWISRFWAEAYAVAGETQSSAFSPSVELLHGQSEFAAYELSGHFLRWLRVTYGVEMLADFYASLERGWAREDVDTAFADIFGSSYEQLIARYELEAEVLYPGFRWCEDAEVIEVPIGETQVTLRADCEAPDTHAFHNNSPLEAMHVRRILRLHERSDLHIEYSSPARILRVHPCFDESGIGWSDPRADWNAWYNYAGRGVPKMDVVSQRDKVAAGDNLFAFAVPLGAPVELELVITATPTHKFDGEPPPDGQFLLALSTDASSELPMQFILTVTNEGGEHDWQPSFTLQPLALDVGSQIEPREPVGRALLGSDVNVAKTWSSFGLRFEASLDETKLPGAANAVDGADINFPGGRLFGNFMNPDALCGTLETGPAAHGGTFAAIRVDDNSPAALPRQFPSSCEELR
jgi:hypothetical protein